MTKKLPTVTIGIPALNEYKNLKRLIAEIGNQTQKKYTLSQIIIISDHSTDSTQYIQKDFPKDSITLLNGKRRLGKPARINQIFSVSKSDFVVIFDADIHLASRSTIDNLFADYHQEKEILISGLARPEVPQNTVQRIAYAGVEIWDRAKGKVAKGDLYFCEGSIRAFSKKVYKNLIFPSTSADEAFSFLSCMSYGWKFKHSSKALVIYFLPTSFKDYFKQQRRYLSSPKIQTNNFSKEMVKTWYVIKPIHKIIALIENFICNPIFTIAYLLAITFVKIDLHIRPAKFTSKWDILTTTKNVKI